MHTALADELWYCLCLHYNIMRAMGERLPRPAVEIEATCCCCWHPAWFTFTYEPNTGHGGRVSGGNGQQQCFGTAAACYADARCLVHHNSLWVFVFLRHSLTRDHSPSLSGTPAPTRLLHFRGSPGVSTCRKNTLILHLKNKNICKKVILFA